MWTISQSLFQEKREEYLFLSTRRHFYPSIMLREKTVPIACPSAGAQPSPTFLVNFFFVFGRVYITLAVLLLLLLLFGQLLQLILLGDGDHLRHRPITHIQQTPSSTHTHKKKNSYTMPSSADVAARRTDGLNSGAPPSPPYGDIILKGLIVSRHTYRLYTHTHTLIIAHLDIYFFPLSLSLGYYVRYFLFIR
jgi:hypothetical protein